ncbi:MAG: hypothetical protein HZA46_25325 [Planctomycetales bacterium]|nr:hypothetical protein [Planctomycetales bacterium]
MNVRCVFTVEDNVLGLEMDDGGTMLAEVSLDKSNKLKVRMNSAGANDPGLEFSKCSS